MNVYQKINEVKKIVKTLYKDAETQIVNEQDNAKNRRAYKYVTGGNILSLIKDKMEEIGLLFLPLESCSAGWREFKYTAASGKVKTDFIVNGRIKYAWINIDEPTDRCEVFFDYYGQQNDISKSYGSALTYSERYMLLKSLGAPTDEDDPDKLSEEKRAGYPLDSQNRKQSEAPKKTKFSENLAFTVGKYAGLSISDVYRKDPEYIRWVANNSRQPELREACAAYWEENVVRIRRMCDKADHTLDELGDFERMYNEEYDERN